MNNAKLSLADLLTLLTACLFAFVCFLGTNFYTLGNIAQSAILSIIIAVLLFGTAIGAKLLKRTSRNFKSFFIWEMILLAIFTILLAFFSYSPFPHYFTVSNQREIIKSKLSESILQAENMFSQYERYVANRESLYKNTLKSVVASKRNNSNEYIAFGFDDNGSSDDTQIADKMFTIHADVYPTNYAQMKLVDSTWLTNAKQTLNNTWAWNFGVVDIVTKIELNSKERLEKLTELSAIREKEEVTTNFLYDLSFKNVKTHFTTLGKPTNLSIGLSCGVYALMLLSWLVTKRHTRFPGLKVIFSKAHLGTNSGRTIVTE